MDQTWSNWNRLDQIGINWIKLVQTWSNWFRLDQIGSNWIKLDQLGSAWHKLEQIGINWNKLDQTWSNWNKLDQTWSNWIKLDQTWSNWIKLDQIVETWGWGLVPHPYLILCLFIFDYWKTWLKLVMLENLQACFIEKHQFRTPIVIIDNFQFQNCVIMLQNSDFSEAIYRVVFMFSYTKNVAFVAFTRVWIIFTLTASKSAFWRLPLIALRFNVVWRVKLSQMECPIYQWQPLKFIFGGCPCENGPNLSKFWEWPRITF